MSTLPAVHLFTVEEFRRMGEAGVFPPDRRFELIDGQIIAVSPAAPPHTQAVMVLNRLLSRQNRYFVSVQNPAEMSRHDQPEPDLALVEMAAYDELDHKSLSKKYLPRLTIIFSHHTS
ncbi:MAG: Uma2 family endonuclease [Catalinimonas sp.]